MTDYNMDVWIERDNAIIDIRDSETEQNSVFTLNGIEAVNEFIEDGFMRNTEDSSGMLEYLQSVGILTENDDIVKIT